MPEQSPDRPTRLPAGGTNAVGRMAGLLGDEWTQLLVQHALRGTTRYGQFKRELPISDAVLAARLALLTREGLLARQVYQQNPLRAEYVTTPRSRSLWPFLLTVWAWERRWVPAHAHDLPRMRHTTCGTAVSPVLCCEACGVAAPPRSVTATFGPSGGWDRCAPATTTRRRSEPDTIGARAGLFPDTMTILGNRWASAMIAAAFLGVHRFSDFERTLGVPPSSLADRLRDFVGIDVLAPVRSPLRPDWVEYHLTEKGRAFFPVVMTSLHWAQQWFVAPEGPAVDLTHRPCGADFRPQLRCDGCAEPLRPRTVAVEPATGEVRDLVAGA